MHQNNTRCESNLRHVAMAALLFCGIAYSAESADIEIDPADFVLGGYRIHAGYIRSPMRYDVGILNVEIPALLHGNDKFNYEISGITGRIDYLFDSYQGFFIGLEGTQMKNRYSHKGTGISETRYPFLLAARIGYRFEFFQHLTVTPWLGLGVLLNKGSDYVIIDQDKFKVSTINAFPTVHLGWVF